jgi:hypothetical protein
MASVRLFAVATMITACAARQAETTIRGRVLHPHRGPLSGVKVAIDSTQKSVVTDSNGRYEIRGRFEAGCQTLTILEPGYDLEIRTFGIARPDTINLEDITLHEASAEPVAHFYVDCATPVDSLQWKVDSLKGFNPPWGFRTAPGDP